MLVQRVSDDVGNNSGVDVLEADTGPTRLAFANAQTKSATGSGHSCGVDVQVADTAQPCTAPTVRTSNKS